MAQRTNRMASIGQRMGQVARKAAARSGGGNFSADPAIYESWWPRKDSKTWIRLIAGDYKNPEDSGLDPFATYVEHRKWGGKFPISVPCVDRARGEKKSDDCVGCYATTLDDNISRSTKRAFSVVVLASFHQEKKQSQHKEGKEYIKLKQCEGRVCKMCDAGLPKIFGARRWWSVGRDHFTQLSGLNDTLGGHCTCGGRVQRTGFSCTKGHELLEVKSSQMTDSQIEVFAQTVSKCRECNVDDIPVENLECSQECKSPQRLDIFSVNMQIMTKGESTDSSVVMVDWVAEDIPAKYKGSHDPHDFDKLLAYPPHGLVASRFGIENPFAGRGATTPHDGKVVDTKAPTEDEASVPYEDEQTEEPAERKETVGARAGGDGDGAEDDDRYED